MASEYWLCVQIPACPGGRKRKRISGIGKAVFFTWPSNFSGCHGTNRVRGPTMVEMNEEAVL
ncbi:hypothetical protein PDR5_29170 [Pseudomonas sp. DR 5-09]|nr:hypothetical protein PDR5_29170 [Pseudomonas sp. DR 5-09]